MRLPFKSCTLLLLVIVLVSCVSSKAISTIPPISIPTRVSKSTPYLEPTTTPNPSPKVTYLSPTQTVAVPVAITRTTITIENGLVWTECVVPNRVYSMTKGDMRILKKCVDPFGGNNNGEISIGERVKGDLGFDDLNITTGKDHFEARTRWPRQGWFPLRVDQEWRNCLSNNRALHNP